MSYRSLVNSSLDSGGTDGGGDGDGGGRGGDGGGGEGGGQLESRTQKSLAVSLWESVDVLKTQKTGSASRLSTKPTHSDSLTHAASHSDNDS